MSLTPENTKFNKTDLSGYKCDRRSFPDGWGVTLPEYWVPGGFFFHISDNVLLQNIQSDPRLPANWTVRASTLARAEGIILALG